MAAENAEYLASGPRFCTACDSNCPGVSENNVCEAISGMNIPPANDLIISAIAIAMAPAASPPANEVLTVIVRVFPSYALDIN